MKICVNCIATNKYIELIPQLIESIDKYFLVEHDVTVNVFTDNKIPFFLESGFKLKRLNIQFHLIPAYKFPEATLLRYHIMTGIDYDCDYIYYLDADMKIVDFVGDEIIGDLVAVRHPGYFMEKGSGSWETRKESACYVPEPLRVRYYAGGFNGGRKELFILVMNGLKEMIQTDLDNGIIPIWHDESAFNKFLICYVMGNQEDITELNPSYCMPEAISKRKYSRIENLPAKILALEKRNDIRD